MKILAIDPGTTESGYCIMDDYKPVPVMFGKLPNDLLLDVVSKAQNINDVECVVIEMVESYGNAVGQTVFETCVWIGRFMEAAARRGFSTDRIFRTEEKLMICHSRKAKDTNIRTALIDRFAAHDKERGKGTKTNPDWFYGFAKDAWMAYAVGVTWLDKQKGE